MTYLSMDLPEKRLKLIEQIMHLDEESLAKVELLIEEITSSQVPEWQREIVQQRLRDHNAHPDDGEPWEVVLERLREGL